MGYLLFRTQNILIAAAGTTITHGLSRATADLHVLITNRGTTTLSLPFLSALGPNTVDVASTGDSTPCDVAVLEFHSIQGGPT